MVAPSEASLCGLAIGLTYYQLHIVATFMAGWYQSSYIIASYIGIAKAGQIQSVVQWPALAMPV